MPYNVDDLEDLDENILSAFLNNRSPPSAVRNPEHLSNAATKVDLERLKVVDLQSSEDEAEEEVNSAISSSGIDGASVQSDVTRHDSLTSAQKDGLDNSITAETTVDPVQSPVGFPQTQPRKLVSGVLPTEIRARLDQWYAQKGIDQPPPCAIPEYIRSVFTTDRGKPVKFEHQNGEQLEVMLYTLPELVPRFKEKLIIVAQGPEEGPFIICYLSRANATRGRVPYFVWEGLSSNDPFGWESEPSISKVVMPMMLALGHGDNPSRLLGQNNGVVESDNAAEVDHIGAHVKAEDNTQLNYAQKSDWHQSPEPETIPTTLPIEIRMLLDRWYSHRGSKQPPPCAVGNVKIKYLNTSTGGYTCTFSHRTGMRLKISIYILLEFASSFFEEKYIIVAEGQGWGPFVIGLTSNHVRSPPFPYSIWEGLDAENPDGWENEASVRMDFDGRQSSLGGPRDEVGESVGDHALNDSDEDSINCSSETPVRAMIPTHMGATNKLTRPIMSHNTGSDRIVDENPLPDNVKQLINQWCDRAGPAVKLESLPFATGSHHSTLIHTPTCRPVYWEYKDGSELHVSMYPLRGVEINYSCKDKNKVIVAQGANLEPSIIAYAPGGAMKEQASYRIWKGIAGNKDGFEEGPSIRKIFLAKSADVGKMVSEDKLVQKKPPLPRFQRAETDKKSVKSDPTTRKRKRADYVLDPDLIIGQGPSSQLRTQARDSKSFTRPTPSTIKQDIQNNTAVLFYSQNSKTPRVRLFSACSTVQKLFAQAMASDLFDDSGGTSSKIGGTGGRVLSFRFGGVRKEIETSKNILVVEEDEDDFEALVSAIEAKDWWVPGKSGDPVEGSGTVEVRAKG